MLKAVHVGAGGQCEAPFRFTKLPNNLSDYMAALNTVLAGISLYESQISLCMQLAKHCTSSYGPEEVERPCKRSLVGGMMPDGMGRTDEAILARVTNDVLESLFDNFRQRKILLLRVSEGLAAMQRAFASDGIVQGISSQVPGPTSDFFAAAIKTPRAGFDNDLN